MTVRRIQTAMTLPKGKRAPELIVTTTWDYTAPADKRECL